MERDPVLRRSWLCSIDPITDITSDQSNVTGGLGLIRTGETFAFQWVRSGAIATLSQDPYDDWQPGATFKLPCGQCRLMLIRDSPLSILLYRLDRPGPRMFTFNDTEFICMADFLEQLLIKGIAVPSPADSFAFVFYSRCCANVFPNPAPRLQLYMPASRNLDQLWSSVCKFFSRVATSVDKSDALPNDPEFPLEVAAAAAHEVVLGEINAFADTIPLVEQVKESEWASLFDDSGRMIDPETFRKRVFHVGVEQGLISRAMPFIFNVYAYDSTLDERNRLDQSLDDEFALLLAQAVSFESGQITDNKKLADAYRVIAHDVNRTDRERAAFRQTDSIGQQMITGLLQAYCVFNPTVGYLQGMNDLFVPIIISFIPNWNENGTPIDDNGEVIDHKPLMPLIFWCFEAMIRNIDHIGLLVDVTECCKAMAETIHKMLMVVSPVMAIWMKRMGTKNLLWMYSDFVLLFKRSVSDIWPLWLQMNASQCPEKWLAYFTGAIILLGFDQQRALPNQSITTMMEAFPVILADVTRDMWKVGVTALWLLQKVPVTSASGRALAEKEEPKFKFFETGWTGPCETSREYT